ncbi:MAG: carboxypeptidase regulatory-like domain-containing protein, partial [Armatimonadota bacterium]
TVNNYFGAHLLHDRLDATGKANLSWARNLIGKGGYCKTLFGGIRKDTKGADQAWVDFVNEIYRLDMIPVVRLAGDYGGQWAKPEMDTDGTYKSMGEAVKRVVAGLPRSDKYPLYIEVWNEPNLSIEWSGKPNLPEYAQFFVDVSKAIRTIGDKRIVIMNGAFALSPEATEECIKANPDFISAFDVWASHPYPQNHPPSYNIHDGTAKYQEATIDGYLTELAVLEKHGRKNVKVIITETGWNLGNAAYEPEGFPAVNELNRADYAMRAFRDYYPKWKELLGVIPFIFAAPGWDQHNWVKPDSATDAEGLPATRAQEYDAVRFLARPTDSYGAISGTVMDKQYNTRIGGCRVTLVETGAETTTDAMGNYWFPKLEAGAYTLKAKPAGFKDASATASVKAGANAVADIQTVPSQMGDVTGVVIDGMTGQPLGGAIVRLTPGDFKTTSDQTGAFHFGKLPPITFALSVTKAGYNTYDLTTLLVKPGNKSNLRLKIGEDKWPRFTNMATNSSFENVADPNVTKMQSVTWEPLKMGDWQVTTSESRTGARSQMLNPTPGAATAIRQITNYNYTKAGKTYGAGVWIKTIGLKPHPTWLDNPGLLITDLGAHLKDGAWLAMTFTGNGGEELKEVTSRIHLVSTSDWKYFSVSGIAPANSARLSINLWIRAKSGAAYFDDAWMGLLE